MKAGLTGAVSGFVLVGGRSTRLGVDKATYVLDGRIAADRMASMLSRVCGGGVTLVGRDSVTESEFPSVPDIVESQGPLGGIATALEMARTTLALVLATDLWWLGESGVRRLVETGESMMSEGEPIDVVVAATGPSSEQIQPLCSLWRVESCRDRARARLDGDDRSMFGLLSLCRVGRVPFSEAELLNVNESQDLQRFLMGEGTDR